MACREQIHVLQRQACDPLIVGIDDGGKILSEMNIPAFQHPHDVDAASFDQFTAAARRDYVEWIVEAKRPETRARRIAQAVAWLAEGKKRHWKHGS